MSVSKRERKAAIELCELSADCDLQNQWTKFTLLDAIDEARPGAVLAWKAFEAVDDSVGGVAFEKLEAAALLRDGWNPGDPVVRR